MQVLAALCFAAGFPLQSGYHSQLNIYQQTAKEMIVSWIRCWYKNHKFDRMIDKNNIGWFAHPQFLERAKIFAEKYQMIDFIVDGDLKFIKKILNGRYGDNCLFCGKSFHEVSFKNAPHLLSKMIGSNLYSNFECDNCNTRFSKLETDFSYYLGIGRSISGLHRNRKAPGFSGIGVDVKTLMFRGNQISAIYKVDAEQNIEKGETKLKYGKPTHTRANVYKLLLKYCLSVLPNEEVKLNYKKTLSFIQDEILSNISPIHTYRYPFTVTMPLHAYVFKKKKFEDKTPTHTVTFYFDNLVISLPLPFHKDDLNFDDTDFNIFPAPPYFIGGNDMNSLNAVEATEDLSSTEKLKQDPEEMIVQYNTDDLAKASMINLVTGEVSQNNYNPTGSKYIIATKPGISFTKEELIELVEIIDKKFSSDEN